MGRLLGLTLVLTACGSERPAGEPRGLTIDVAPLELAGIGDACFDLRVTNAAAGAGEVVWSRGTPGLNGGTPDAGAICSDRFGDGAGDVTYIGTCDASGELDGDPAGERMNSVTLWFDALYDDADAYLPPDGANGWQDPCPTGCTLDVLCEENADALVAFDFTVMRDAEQGFFDVAVAFEDIFCSAKLDTCYEDGSQMNLLFGADQDRDWTAVFGFACTAGADTVTNLHYGDLAVVCTSGATTTVFPLNPVGPTGNNQVTVGDHTLHYGVYRGTEALPCDDPGTAEVESCGKVYWNLAISLDDLAPLGVCTFAFSATATDAGQGFANGLPAGAGVSYPYIDVAATLAPPSCQRHKLGDGGAVKTAYHGNLAGQGLAFARSIMCSAFDGTGAGPIAGADCSDSCPNDPDKTLPGLCGCGTPDTDSDGDLSPDCNDGCDADPAKAAPGACGCNIADLDSDNDGSADCVDECDNDPAKTTPGLCGCGTLDTDTDGDTTPDCSDLCPADPSKVESGACGCGTPDTDTDNDTTPDCFDECDNDPAKTAPGLCGCDIADTDTDGDTTPDCVDECANDANKTVPGLCGCGAADTDSDNDGTPDCVDECDSDPTKTTPGLCGCDIADNDADNDGTPDCDDLCPADPDKTAAGICGCGVADTDSDNDGTADCDDSCVADPFKTAPGTCGCGVADTNADGDGSLDCQETCDNDPNKTAPGVCGCGVADTDSDNDGTPDCNDGCPADAAKLAPGTCGCGVADTNSDGDGSLDCQETCDNDPLKTAPGLCGCGVADTDTDSDGTPDCNETCDTDPLKTAPGLCGCGVADTDTDSDGTPDCNETCDTDPLKTAPGVCGCGTPDTNSDGDAALDCNEACDTDPLKTAPGLCGCGVADTDSDNDGTPDCTDECDNDPAKTTPGTCGCGTPDTNSDGDGSLDCQETCDLDPNKTAPGVCGCGTPDTDSDADGSPDCIETCDLDPLKTSPGTCGCGVPDSASARLGGTQATAASSCVAIVDEGDACGDGVYWIDPNGGATTDATQVYCDMTTDGGGWMKLESATYPFWFNDTNWHTYNTATPLADNFSIVGQRNSFVDVDGCYELRLQVGNSGNWQSAQAHETIWRQCHDPFTQTTAGADYTYISGEVSTTCGGFNGLHHKYQGNSYTSDPDLNDSINCWWMQIVPKVQYDTPANYPGYLEGYGGSGNVHKWQSLWIRAAGLGKGREAPGATCEALRQAGVTDDGVYWLDPNGGSNSDAFKAYCDMTATVGWTRVEAAKYPFFFTSGTWESYQIDSVTADNYSMLTRRALFASGGCTTWRMQFGDSGSWTSAPAHETAWTQCHDPFTAKTDGSDYTYVSGVAPVTCDGFNGLHNSVQSFMYTSDADSTDAVGCWGMQMVPHTQYPSHPGYYDGYFGGAASHQWQTMWVK